MIAPKCNYCGSLNLRADRALAGKLICVSCGKIITSSKQYIGLKPIKLRRANKTIYIILLTIILIFLIVLIG